MDESKLVALSLMGIVALLAVAGLVLLFAQQMSSTGQASLEYVRLQEPPIFEEVVWPEGPPSFEEVEDVEKVVTPEGPSPFEEVPSSPYEWSEAAGREAIRVATSY